ncbi:MAG: phosphotransacetylase [Actinomycetota bacterium]|nr:phosphotransacetylase [Actinomycetota bacterium]
MSQPPTCPRCAGPVRPPGLMSSDWHCELHGAVHPYSVAVTVGPEALDHLTQHAAVPVWCPVPLLPKWTVTGVAQAGDERTGARATVLACAGPAPLGGVADLLLVAEEPGIGLGAHHAGLPGPDPGREFTSVPAAKILVAGHPTPLWSVPADEHRCVFVGEAMGLWLWAVLWPLDAGYVFIEHVELHDLREQPACDLEFGAPSPYLRPGIG